MALRYLLLLPILFISSWLAAGPVAVCEAYVYVSLPVDACEVSLTPAMIDGGSYETFGGSVSLRVNGGNNLTVGTYTVTMTVTSRWGTNSCWSQVTVEDKTDPTVTCHNQTHYLVAPDQPVTYNLEDMVTITDNCDPVPIINITVTDNAAFGSFPFSASATDDGGNSGSCSGTVTTIDAEPQNYCSSSRSAYYEHISNVQIGALNHSSGADGYNWHYPSGANNIYHGSAYTMSYTPGFRFSTTYHEYWSVYIDKNGDGDFTDSGELLHQWHGYGGNSFTFTSPGTYWGWSRIRVVMKYGGYATSPCGGGGYGETEDISVYLRPWFWFPWPGFKQQDVLANQDAVASQELVLGSDRPVEEALPEEAEQRRQQTAPQQAPSFARNAPAEISVFPNPVLAGQQIKVTGQEESSEMVLRAMTGQVVKQYMQGTVNAEVPANLPAGIYLLSGVAADTGKTWTRRVVVR